MMKRKTTFFSFLVLVLLLSGCASGPDYFSKPLQDFRAEGRHKSIELSWRPLPVPADYIIYWSKNKESLGKSSPSITTQKASYNFKSEEIDVPHYFFVEAKIKEATTPSSVVAKAWPVVQELYLPNHIIINPQPWDSFESLAKRYLGDENKAWMLKDFNKIEKLAPYKPISIPKRSYKKGGLGIKRYQTIPVLLYHRIHETTSNKMTLPVEKFEEQMRYLKDNNFTTVTLEEVEDFVNFKNHLPEKPVVISFDDGWRSTYDLAFPILKKYNHKASLFVTTGWVDGKEKLALSWDLIREMYAQGLDVQCHTVTHRNLKRRKNEPFNQYFKTVQWELKHSSDRIQTEIGRKCKYLAYPYGSTNHLVIAIAQKQGYQAGFTVRRGPNPFFFNNFRLHRSTIYGEYDLQKFATQLKVSQGTLLR